MPREITFVSVEPIALEELVEAAEQVDDTLVTRTLLNGWMVQFVDFDDQAVLSIEPSREVEDIFDAKRMTGTEFLVSPLWWTEATAPWGPVGETGVRIAQALEDLTGADVFVHEG